MIYFGYDDVLYVSYVEVSIVSWCVFFIPTHMLTLLWRHNGRDGVSNNQTRDCLLNRLFRCRSKKTSKLRVTWDRWIPRTNGQLRGKCLHLITSSCTNISTDNTRDKIHHNNLWNHLRNFRLIFILRNPILIRRHLYIDTTSWCDSKTYLCCSCRRMILFSVISQPSSLLPTDWHCRHTRTMSGVVRSNMALKVLGVVCLWYVGLKKIPR